MGFMDFLSKLVPFELFRGMALTGGYFFRHKETVQYPEQRLEPADRFRGMFGYDLERHRPLRHRCQAVYVLRSV